MVSLLRTSDPAAEPVTQSEMEAQLVLSSGFDSARVLRIIEAARQIAEKDLQQSFITQTWQMKLNDWPNNRDYKVYLFNGPVQSITSVTYLDADGNSQTLTQNTHFKLNTGTIPYLTPIDGWPTVYNDDWRETITITYVTGYGDAAGDVPGWAKEAILAKGTLLYTQGQINTEMIYNSIISKHKIYYDWLSNAS